jgi:DNA-binding IscR family transcriptional regulator
MPDCSIRSVWRMLQNAVDQVLGRITLKDLLVSEREMSQSRSAAGAMLPTYSQQA